MTLRVAEKIHLCSSAVRFGANGSCLDNVSAGGLCCGINENGEMAPYAFDHFAKRYDRHPFTGQPFAGLVFEGYPAALRLAMELHDRLPYFDLISWDMSLNCDGKPILIELNIKGQDTCFLQFFHGPLFGEYTEAVLNKVLR